METVPIQTVVGICTGFLSVIGGIIIWSLTKLQSDIKDTKESVSTLERKMVTELDKKANISEMNLRFDSIDESLKRIETMIPKVNQTAEDMAFLKGKEEARREMLSK
jgi:predicted Holliday junction resolvase-like endonuclease